MPPVTPARALVGCDSGMALLTELVKALSAGRQLSADRRRAGHREVRAGAGGGGRGRQMQAARSSGGPVTS